MTEEHVLSPGASPMERYTAQLSEREHAVARVESERRLAPGRLAPRDRCDALLDPDSFLEVGGLARSQIAAQTERTPSDGVITGYGRIEGREVAVIAEDPAVLERTDGLVGRAKRERLLANAIRKNIPVLFLADGPRHPESFQPTTEGRLYAGLPSRGYTIPSIDESEAPIVTVVLGDCGGGSADLALASDAVVWSCPFVGGSNGRGAIHASPGAALVRSCAAITATDDRSAIATARRLLGLMPRTHNARLGRIPTPEAVESSDESLRHADTPATLAAATLLDRGSAMSFQLVAPLFAAIGTIDGYPAVVVEAGDGVHIDGEHLRALTRVVRLARRLRIPLVTIQDTPGYDATAITTSAFLSALRELGSELMAQESPKLSIIAGRGHALGTWVLGGRALGYDYVAAWASATVGAVELPMYVADAVHDGEPGPWLAAGLGVVDDVIHPDETRSWVARLIDLLAPSRAYPSAAAERGPRTIDEIPSV